MLRSNTDPGVLHGEQNFDIGWRDALLPKAKHDFAFGGELDRITAQVQENLM
jgi:hypothetical protein